MNTKRTEFNLSLLPKRNLTPYWLLGFVEGDGSFCLPNLIPSLVIKQHSKNKHVLLQISKFLSDLTINSNLNTVEALNKPTPGIYNSSGKSKSSNVLSLQISNTLQIFYHIMPFFKALEFKSRKKLDFKYWEAAVNLKALGYTTLPLGRKYFIAISEYINNKRYSTSLTKNKAPDMENIENLLKTPPIFDLTSGLSFKDITNLARSNKGGTKGFGVNVYEKGILLEGSPFSSYTKAALALGNVNISSVISKNIDTGKLYKQRFKFESVSIKK
uniref:Homing endonuclease LAGLIDADG domain-containing protein n=1 Tax=Dactylella sp. TaxID=1814903 RepID=A0A482DQR5_9PEZI|nr:hypothetical protein [Dactylella sp.]